MQGVIFWGQVNELAEIILRKDSVFHKGKQKCLFFFIKKARYTSLSGGEDLKKPQSRFLLLRLLGKSFIFAVENKNEMDYDVICIEQFMDLLAGTLSFSE